MRNTENITEEMVLPVINAMVHGTIKVTYATLEAKEKMDKAVFLINKIHKGDYMNHRLATETIYDPEQKIDVEYESENKYALSWGDRRKAPEPLTDNDMTIHESIHRIITAASVEFMDVNYGLLPYVRKVAKEMGVKTINSLGRVGINAARKNESLYKQLEKAYKSGVESVSFDSDKINVQTLRVYATQFNRFSKEKIAVNWDGNKATVIFKVDKNQEALNNIKAAIYNAVELCGREAVINAIEAIIGIEKPTKEEWQRLGYDSEQEWSDHMKDKEESAAEDWKSEPDSDEWKEDDGWN